MAPPSPCFSPLHVGYPVLDVANGDVTKVLNQLQWARGHLQLQAAMHDLVTTLATLFEIRLDLMAVYEHPGRALCLVRQMELMRFLEAQVIAFDLGVLPEVDELVAHLGTRLGNDVRLIDQSLVRWIQEAQPSVPFPGATIDRT